MHGLRSYIFSAATTAAVLAGTFGHSTPATAIPDFGGIWDHPGLPAVEPLASGPTRLKNLSRTDDGIGNNLQMVGDYRNPILKPKAAARVKKFGEMSLTHFAYPTPRNQCWPGGVPFQFTDGNIMMLQTPGEITIVYHEDHQVRHIRMDSSHPEHVAPSWNGDSVGHYEGDTLVIDTVGVKIGPFAMVDWFGTPHSPALHVVERYRMLDFATAKEALDRNAKENHIIGVHPVDRGTHLQLFFTVEDPGSFTMPWSATVTYSHPNASPRGGNRNSEWEEQVCAENPHKYGVESDAAVPTAPIPDF